MSFERSRGLAQLCTELIRKGNDFPTVWNTVLKRHTLVNGIPQQAHDGHRGFLEIPLITGERLVFDADGKKFSLK